ncbi:hypothetical protein IAE60_11665 [Pseudoxanthomonas mexicana]|uniref:DUF2007 domain-containing protein n=1 Tax=Pseudoxanthomonas mexicana TaxID=128785 RepID=A0A7G9T926_PSEMX|nr:DUF6164 family protein [Pseudoxanthomonas mexicana]QNN76601.1 hypothetical protein IAE60_11665 [Pseudoxanthomonas mexicana]
MAKLFLNLRNVPADEADDVRDLLRTNAIDFYETQPSPWGISAGGLWIEDVDQLTRAKTLMADYQTRRRDHARSERAIAEREGRAETFAGLLRDRPLYVVGVLAAVLFILAVTLALPWLLL